MAEDGLGLTWFRQVVEEVVHLAGIALEDVGFGYSL
jgi:hypothetical protein